MIRSFEKRAAQKISGFQSPAADYLEGRLDLGEKLVIDPNSTFYFQMQGTAMLSYSIADADLLVIDRSLKPCHGSIEGHHPLASGRAQHNTIFFNPIKIPFSEYFLPTENKYL